MVSKGGVPKGRIIPVYLTDEGDVYPIYLHEMGELEIIQRLVVTQRMIKSLFLI